MISTIASIALFVVCLYLGCVAGKWLFGKSNKVSGQLAAQKKAALTLAITLREYGLKLLPAILEDFAVFDVADMVAKMHDTAKLVDAGSDAILKDLEATYERVLDKKLSQPEGLALVKAKIAAIEAPR